MVTNREWTNVIDVLNDFGKYLVEEYKDQLILNDVNASDELYNSVNYIFKENGGTFEVSLELADYWKYVENGRKAGKWPPISAIEKWVEIKPVLPRPITLKNPKESMIFAIRNSIIKKSGGKKKPPIKAIEKWVDKNNIQASQTVLPTTQQLAFLIARKIGLEGIAPRPLLQKSVDNVWNNFEEFIAEAFAKDLEKDIEITLGTLRG